MDFSTGRAWLEVDLGRIGRNLNLIQSRLSPGSSVMAVVKADAYGQGAVAVSRFLESRGVTRFAVATLAEAAALRGAGLSGDLLVLTRTPPRQAAELAGLRLIQTVFSPEYARALDAEAALAGLRLPVHVKLDTGLTRTGFDCGTDAQLEEVAAVWALPHLAVCGVFSHFASADDGSEGADEYCRLQIACYQNALLFLHNRGLKVGLRHICNTGGTEKYPEAHFDMVRCGAALAGYNTAFGIAPWPLEPAADLKTRVVELRDIPAGRPVSYSRTWRAKGPTRVAVLSIGYADGYPRALSNRGRVIIRGQWAPQIGNVGMDQMMVDVSHIPGVAPGDVATLMGRDGALTQTADDLAGPIGSCMHEILSRMGMRLERIYTNGAAE